MSGLVATAGVGSEHHAFGLVQQPQESDCGRPLDRARRALCLQQLKVSDREDPFAAIIRCTVDPAKADKRTRSKWSRAMRYAAAYKPDSEPLDRFIRRKGGINACAGRFGRCLGRGAAVMLPNATRR
jgi:hypothetical protein